MTIKHDIQANLKDAVLTKIEGQPRTETLNRLVREISEILVDIETTNGGGEHGHLGMIMSDTEYVQISKGGEKWIVPTNPGPYPTTVDASTSDFDREKAVPSIQQQSWNTKLTEVSRRRSARRSSVQSTLNLSNHFAMRGLGSRTSRALNFCSTCRQSAASWMHLTKPISCKS